MEKTIYHLMLFKYLEHAQKYNMILQNTCQRCGNSNLSSKDDYYYCSNCSELGIISSDTVMYKRQYTKFSSQKYDMKIDYPLSPLQAKASKFIIDNIKAHNNVLIWAVCGAGKTEITFDAIHKIIKQGNYVAFAITRVDIVYEIYERLKATFTNSNIGLMTGEKKIDFQNAQIFVLTTNQLLKFKDAFSLIIIDEVDAFPYEYNPKFDYGVNNSLRNEGTIVYLTSTPSHKLLNKNLETFKIYKRWHNFDLPVPIFHKLSLTFLNYKLIHPLLYYHLKKSNKQCLIFISNIPKGKQLNLIMNKFNLSSKFTYSSDKNKIKTIQQFKANKFKYLISTTILERGVTFDDIDVFIIDASSKLYNIAALVQIAGRARRKKEFQEGKVIFFYQEITKTMTTAKKQIVEMNNLKNKN